jgi:hypothetical protein|tara:strand:+ start:1690 stop:2355 length:666 start_codon:yes stop_codon:yes gene_type:complete
MKLITEVNESVDYLTEAKEDGSKDYFIKGIFMQSNLKNRNNRMYSEEVLDKEVKRYTDEYISKNRAYGELGHPSGPTINLDRVSHMIKELYKDGNNYIGKAKIMTETPMGKIVKNLIDEGASLGVSSRGMGSLKNNREGIAEVQNDFYLATAADIVADPSAPDAFVEGIMEGVDFWFGEDGRIHREIVATTAKHQVEEAVRSNSLDEATKFKIFEQYLKSL